MEHQLKMDIGELVENTDQNNCTGNCNQGRNCDCSQNNSGMVIAYGAVAFSGFIVGLIIGAILL